MTDSGIGQFMRPDLAAERPKTESDIPKEGENTVGGGVGAAVSEADVKDAAPSAKDRSQFFVAVRARGLVNAMMEQADAIIKAKYPGMDTRWEYAPPNGDDSMVIAREAQGFRVVNNSELGTDRRPGPVRRGDLIQMIGPAELAEELRQMDARAAYEDLKAPEEAFKSSLEQRKVTTKDGTQESAKPVGKITTTTEIRTAVSRPDGNIAIGPKQ